MNKKNRHSLLTTLLLSLLLFSSCEQDNYDKGEGEYSLMRADFVQAHVGGDKRVDYIVTDDGDSLATDPKFTSKAIETADTIYRAILYYNKVKGTTGNYVAEAKGMSIVPTLFPSSLTHHPSPMKTDPVKFESLWVGANRRYVNLSIYLMTNQLDNDDAKQVVAIVKDKLVEHADGKRTLNCRLYHDQNGVPEYYSQQCYISIPANVVKADSLRLTINTYQGEIIKTISTF